MQRIRDSIKQDKFPQFVIDFIRNYYAKCNYPKPAGKNGEEANGREECTNEYNIPDWVVNALKTVNIDVLVNGHSSAWIRSLLILILILIEFFFSWKNHPWASNNLESNLFHALFSFFEENVIVKMALHLQIHRPKS